MIMPEDEDETKTTYTGSQLIRGGEVGQHPGGNLKEGDLLCPLLRRDVTTQSNFGKLRMQAGSNF
jgi:hypothetical protein